MVGEGLAPPDNDLLFLKKKVGKENFLRKEY